MVETNSPHVVNPPPKQLLHEKNWNRGFLMNAVWMAGISENEGNEKLPLKAWVVSLESGNLIAATDFKNLREALDLLNRLPGTEWTYEPTKSCSGEKCGPENCKGSACKIFKAPNEAQCTPFEPVSTAGRGGAFLYPLIDGKKYINSWIRWGSSQLFGEINYIDWQETIGGNAVSSSSIGLTVGAPLFKFY